MSGAICSETTVQLRGFTVSSDPFRWAVLRVATIEEARKLTSRTELRQFYDVVAPQDFTSPRGICDALERIQTSPHTYKEKMCAFVYLFCAGFLIDGYGDFRNGTSPKPRLRLDAFYGTEAETFVTKCEALGEIKESKYIKRIFLKLWLCSAEARNRRPTGELIQEWIRFHLSQTNEKNRKWLPMFSKTTLEALRVLVTVFRVQEGRFKYSPRRKVIDELKESKFFQIWDKEFSAWLESRRYADVTKAKDAFALLQRYWCDHPVLLDPELFFCAHLRRESILDWASKPELKISVAKLLRVINQFVRAFVASKAFLSVPDECDDDELCLRDGYEWPISNFDLCVIAEKIGEVEHNGKSNNKSLPESLLWRIEGILTEDDMSWPKKRDADWLELPGTIEQAAQKIFCPVLPSMIRILLKLPLRSIQVRRLDSGEGDEYLFDKITRKFQPNSSPHAGYWARQSDVRNPRRGVLRKFFDATVQKDYCGFYINSNKTRDRSVLFDENSGYEIFWEFDEVIDIILNVREWQETYNPVAGPIKFEDLPPATFAEASANVSRRKPACFYLFRYPCGVMSDREAPPTADTLRHYWYECLAELERRLADEVESPPILIDKWNGNIPVSSPYHLHGLRLGGLTRLAKAGISPWILQNVVGGHANWVMTAYYIQPGFAFVTEHLTAHYVKALQDAQSEFAQFLSEATIENVHRIAILKSKRAIGDLEAARAIKSTYLMATLDNGICANGQTRCDEGCSIIQWSDRKDRSLRSTSIPVPILPNGKRDCARCDFFITGTPFMDGTAVRCNEISLELSTSVERMRSFMREIDRLENERLTASRNDTKIKPSVTQSLQAYRAEYKTESDNMVELATSLNANLRKLEEIKALKRRAKTEGHLGPALLTISDCPEFMWGEIHRFEAIDELCRASRWFKSIRFEPLKNERLAMILKIYSREGQPPPLALLNEHESISAIEDLTELIRRRLNRQSVAALLEGYETFESLGLSEDVDSTIAHLQANGRENRGVSSVNGNERFLPAALLPPDDALAD